MKNNKHFPADYAPHLDLMQTELAIKLLKDTFERELANNLHLTRVSAPLMVTAASGLNDNLNGIERPVGFDAPDLGDADVQIVQSLAKWKRLALYRYGFARDTGLYTDMNAIRRDETLDAIHSLYVDQWDWEKVIDADDRNLDFLQDTVNKIYTALKNTEAALISGYPQYSSKLPENIYFISSQELLDLYPDLDPKERENAIAKAHGAVFIMQIGSPLTSGEAHDGRAPDYDDWQLNGDLLVYNRVLDQALEISSMGIRVDAKAMDRQLTSKGSEERRSFPFHSMVLGGTLPLTIGGGLGQSRICMYLLEKAHIGEVQASLWPCAMLAEAKSMGIVLL